LFDDRSESEYHPSILLSRLFPLPFNQGGTMTPTIRVKLGLVTIASVLLATFAWSTAQGQIRPPGVRPPIVRPPRIQPPRMPGGGVTTTVWKCPTCGFEYQGAIPPSSCPGCQQRMANGVGNGIPGPGGRMNPNPGMNPFAPPTMTPPVMNPNPPDVNPNPPVVNPNPPVSQMPPANPMPPANNDNNPGLKPINNLNSAGDILPVANSSDSSSSTSSDSSVSESKPSSRKLVIALVVGIVVVGIFVLLGGTLLVIYTVRNNGSSSSNRRRRRRRDYDD
jgi:hypothetical protein